jgi:hypothetical protein
MSADAEARARALMAALGAGEVAHPGGPLPAHLERVHRLTVDWSASPRTRLAALCHATYGTHGFPRALLPITDRNRLRDVIGAAAEELVYRYGACDRAASAGRWSQAPLPGRDRFTGATTELVGGLLGDFAVLSIANELDVVRHGSLPDEVVEEIRVLLRALAAHAPDEAAHALGDLALA